MCNGNIWFQVLDVFYGAGIIMAWFKISVVCGSVMVFNILPANVIGTKPIYPFGIYTVIRSKGFRVVAVPGIFIVFNQLPDSMVFFSRINLLRACL